MVKRIFNLSNLTLVTALALSAIAAWYSILGLTAIFAAAVLPIIIMGGSLEVAKVVTTVWLHKYWDKISLTLKLYLVPAVIALAFLTSMGIFGFLSKAHMDQGVPTSNIAAQVALIDEKIKTQRENIDLARKALAQMDAQVEQRLARGDSEAGAERAVAIRKQQAKERASLQNDIAIAQKEIAKLSEERAPIASELRKVEAEVGPIKYIAALIYGDNPDQNVLERAVRWVIILIVFVFDPLALTLVIASNTSRQWEIVTDKEEPKEETKIVDLHTEVPTEVPTETPKELPTDPPIEVKDFDIKEHPYLFNERKTSTPPGIEPCPPMVSKTVSVTEAVPETEDFDNDIIELNSSEPTEGSAVEIAIEKITDVPEEVQHGAHTIERPFKELDDGYVSFEGKLYKRDALKEIKPEFFVLTAADADYGSHFGTNFPKYATKGETFVRVDMIPNKVFKFDGSRWISIAKENSDSYLHDKSYLQYLVTKIDNGEYDVELLSDVEKAYIEEFLRTQKS